MPDIYAIAQQFRAALLSRDRQAATRLIQSYGLAWTHLQESLALLQSKVAAARANGETISAAWLYREERFKALLDQSGQEILRLSQYSDNLITDAQRNEIERASRDAANLVEVAAGNASISATFNRVPMGALEHLVGALGDGSPLAKSLNRYGAEGRAKIEKTLIEGMVAGEGPAKVARRMRNALGGNLTKAMQISRDSMLNAYRESSRANYQASSDIVSGWQWVSARGIRSCPSCWAMDGHIFPLEKPMGLHPNCLLAGVVVSHPSIKAATKRWSEGQVVDITISGGRVLSVTPNHPILTPHGWVAAGRLVEGGYVISSRFPERLTALVGPNNNHIPTKIEQVWESLPRNGDMVRRVVPSAAEYFHGDGEGGEIEIIFPDGQLRCHSNTPPIEPFAHDEFVAGGVGDVDLSNLCPFHQFSFGLHSAARGIMSSLGIGSFLFGRAIGDHQAIRVSAVSDLSAAFQKAPADHWTGKFEASGQGIFRFTTGVSANNLLGRQDVAASVFRFYAGLAEQSVNDFECDAELRYQRFSGLAGLVQFDQIRKLSKRDFSGHVYNLETSTGWYIANGIVTHNCRCTMVPVLKDEPAPLRKTGEQAFAELPEASQREVLGDAKFAAYRDGQITLRSLVGYKKDPKWGEVRWERGLADALKGEIDAKWGELPSADQS